MYGFAKGQIVKRDEKGRILKGNKVPLEVREKIKESMLGDKNPFYGKHHSEETKERMRKIREERGLNISGENHSRWNGGSGAYWRKRALIRDHFTCSVCNLYDP